MNDFAISLLLLGALSASPSGSMPFWAGANRYGVMPDSNGGLALVGMGSRFDESKTIQWRFGLSAGLRTDKTDYKELLLDEAYASLRWQKIRLDAGLWHPSQHFLAADAELGTLSTTGGFSVLSGNARPFPGYSLNLEPWNVPFTGGHLQLMGRFGDYFTTDTRYVRGSMIHNSEMMLRGHIGRHFTVTAGLSLWSEWGGVSPTQGEFRKTFANYLRVITGRHGGDDAQGGERLNALGDHRGCEIIRFDWHTDAWTLSFQHDIPFDDISGMTFRNFPDGVNTLCFSLRDKSQWVSDVVYEYVNTMNQSGTEERRPATEAEIAAKDPRLYTAPDGTVYTITGGADNYFNNYLFCSGWTGYGRCMGLPLFFPRGTTEGTWSRAGITMGIWSNLLQAHHLGVSGSIAKVLPYKLMLTYSESQGTWFTEDYRYGAGSRLERPLRQFSSALMVEVPLWQGIIKVVPALYYDTGEVLRSGFGATLSVRYTFTPTILSNLL